MSTEPKNPYDDGYGTDSDEANAATGSVWYHRLLSETHLRTIERLQAENTCLGCRELFAPGELHICRGDMSEPLGEPTESEGR